MLVPMVGTLLFGLLLYLAYEFFRRYPQATWVVFSILPLLLLPWWIHHHSHTWFGWAKIYSVVLGVLIIQLCRSPRLKDKSRVYLAAYAVLFLNITEAVLNDLLASGWAHRVNAVAGILLIVTMTGSTSMSAESRGSVRDFSWNLPLFWVLGYTFWNINFIYMNYTEMTFAHFAVLGSALAIALYRPKQWFQARAITLGTFLIIDFSYRNFLKPIHHESALNPQLALAVSLFSVVWMIFYLAFKKWRVKPVVILAHS